MYCFFHRSSVVDLWPHITSNFHTASLLSFIIAVISPGKKSCLYQLLSCFLEQASFIRLLFQLPSPVPTHCSCPHAPPVCSLSPWDTSPRVVSFDISLDLFPSSSPSASLWTLQPIWHPLCPPFLLLLKFLFLLRRLSWLLIYFYFSFPVSLHLRKWSCPPLAALLQLISSGGLLRYQIPVWWQGWASFSDPSSFLSHPLSIFTCGLSPRAPQFPILFLAHCHLLRLLFSRLIFPHQSLLCM